MADSLHRPLRVFLSYAKEDRLIVYKLYEQLDAEGWIDAWLDEEKLYPGQDWNYEIEQAVERADVIVICLSQNSVTKEGYVQRELRIALDYADYKPQGTIFVIPIRLDDCELPRRLRPWQYADYFPLQSRSRAYQRLLVSLRHRAKALGILTEEPLDEKKEGKASSYLTPEKYLRERTIQGNIAQPAKQTVSKTETQKAASPLGVAFYIFVFLSSAIAVALILANQSWFQGIIADLFTTRTTSIVVTPTPTMSPDNIGSSSSVASRIVITTAFIMLIFVLIFTLYWAIKLSQTVIKKE